MFDWIFCLFEEEEKTIVNLKKKYHLKNHPKNRDVHAK